MHRAGCPAGGRSPTPGGGARTTAAERPCVPAEDLHLALGEGAARCGGEETVRGVAPGHGDGANPPALDSPVRAICSPDCTNNRPAAEARLLPRVPFDGGDLVRRSPSLCYLRIVGLRAKLPTCNMSPSRSSARTPGVNTALPTLVLFVDPRSSTRIRPPL